MSSAPRFSRYALYFIADPQQPLFQRASRWLGWDCVKGRPADHPRQDELANPTSLNIHDTTAAPRKYGFHGTVKPPMKLVEGVNQEMLMQRASALIRTLTPVRIDRLKLARIGKFLALVPAAPSPALKALASTCVTGLDDLRHPLTEADLARRRQHGLSVRQETLLQAYGYPYVLDEFRFHLTLTGPVDDAVANAAEAMLQTWIEPVLPQPLIIDRLAIAGEDSRTGKFSLIDWVACRTDQTET